MPILTERIKIEKVDLHDKTEYVINIKKLKQALSHRLVLKKVHRVIKFNQMLDCNYIMIWAQF